MTLATQQRSAEHADAVPAPSRLRRPAIPVIVAQHAEDCAVLRQTRSVLLRSAHVTLEQLGRLDERLRGHLDGLLVAGEAGMQLALQALETPSAGAVFTVAALALYRGGPQAQPYLAQLAALAQTLPDAWRGLISALGWAPAVSVREHAKSWLASDHAFARRLGLAACILHRIDPGAALDAALQSDDTRLRADAARAVGALGRADLHAPCSMLVNERDAALRLCALRALSLIGARERALDALGELALTAGPSGSGALPLALLAADIERARALLEQLARRRDDQNPRNPAAMRRLISAVGLVGDPSYIDWLIGRMTDPVLARPAGEAFSLITGADLALLDLEQRPPAEIPAGPNDDPLDAAVALDEDEGMAWPDPARVQAWWASNRSRFTPGARYFCGSAPVPQHCRSVLRGGRQRQRHIAALLLALATPGSVLFNTAAPAWRQRRILGAADRA